MSLPPTHPVTLPPTRSPSLRTRVALASALGTTLVLVALAVLVAVTLTRSEYGRLDARLSAAAAAAVADTTVNPDAAVTVRTPQRVQVLAGPELPALAPGTTTVRVDGTRYRVRTRMVGRTVVSVGEPVAVTQSAVRSLQRTVIVVALVAVAVAAALGWLFAGVAVRPLTRLADRTRELPTGGPAPPTGVRGAREVDQLAREVDALLERVETSQRDTALALQSARDFAATAAHELRTPLTAMRTDLEVLAADLVPEADRAEVLGDLLRTQERVNETLTALVGLATGEVADGAARTSVDLTELVHRVAAEAARAHPRLRVTQWPGPPAPAVVLVAGLVLALTNLVTNAVRHGGAGEIRLGARTVDGGVELVCDDDGCGIPETERTAVLTRFVRGSSASAPGSGLGLALVVQQAQLHGGGVLITDSPLGGARVLLGWPAQPLTAA